MQKTVSILGATGSIGSSALRVINHNKSAFSIAAVTAQKNVAELAKIAIEHEAKFASIADESKYLELKSLLSGKKIEIAAGEKGLEEAASYCADVLIAAIVGFAGLSPTLSAVRTGKTIALANKECLVAAGELFMQEAKTHRARIIPVDSEHNAIFQVFDQQATHITLTASGGPFRNFSTEQMRSVTPAQALKHPKWNMGAKISIDSATMMNKGLEIIEAHHLFGLNNTQIEVLVHPESIVHGMVHFADGSVLAQLSSPDMATPIAQAISYPNRITAPVLPLELSKLTFEKPDETRFPSIRIARAALKAGQAATLTLNAANEVAVSAFLDGKIEFLDICRLCEAELETTRSFGVSSIEDIINADLEIRSLVKRKIYNGTNS